jgi:hypothetical protein
MNGYVIKRSPDGAYVAPAGLKSSYTRVLQNARIFHTRESAERDRCPENEYVVPVEEELRGRDR